MKNNSSKFSHDALMYRSIKCVSLTLFGQIILLNTKQNCFHEMPRTNKNNSKQYIQYVRKISQNQAVFILTNRNNFTETNIEVDFIDEC